MDVTAGKNIFICWPVRYCVVGCKLLDHARYVDSFFKTKDVKIIKSTSKTRLELNETVTFTFVRLAEAFIQRD